MDTTEQYIKMADCEEIQEYWEKPTLALLPSFVYDGEIKRVCVMVWMPDTLRDKIGGEGNAIHISIEYEKEMHSWTDKCDWMKHTIWLPRQDQLQEMVGDKYGNLPYSSVNFGKLLAFLCFCSYDEDICTHGGVSENKYTLQFTSMEQLWLAFVQKELHSKVWNGSKWIKR